MSIAIDRQHAHTSVFSSEYALNCDAINHFWSQVTESQLEISSEITLAYGFIKHPGNTKAIVISNGRVESYLKYKELMFDLFQQGYDIYALDHRGQGLSSRTTENHHQGHIDKFSTYIDDFSCFIEQVVKPKQYQDLFLVGHSMGGAIGTLYIQQYPNTFKAAVFSAPMFGIKLPVHRLFIRWLAAKLDSIRSKNEPNYILGGKDYNPVVFSQNDLTYSQRRYEDYRQLYEARPQLQLGSPTNRWLFESIDASEAAVEAAKTTQVPILILQADADTIVDNSAQNRACGDRCTLINIPKARHELFMETDKSRNAALKALISFIAQHRH